MRYSPAIEKLINELMKLPTIGRRGAERLTFHLLKSSKAEAQELARAIAQLKEKIGFCRQCFNIAEKELCPICSDSGRNSSIICVVEEPMTIMAVEKSGAYKGLYHVLQGLISPLKGITPEDLRIAELKHRVKSARNRVREVIIATPPTVDGDATALYLSQELKPFGVKLSRIGLGIPSGAALEFADEITLKKAIEGRSKIE